MHFMRGGSEYSHVCACLLAVHTLVHVTLHVICTVSLQLFPACWLVHVQYMYVYTVDIDFGPSFATGKACQPGRQ